MPDREPLSLCCTLADHLDLAAFRWPAAEAVIYGDQRFTFSQLARRTQTVARGLRALGVGPGDSVGVLMRNGVDNLAVVYGASRLGAIPVPINGRLKAAELAYVIPHADLRVLIASERLPGILDDAPLLREALPGLPGQHPDALELREAPALKQVIMWGEQAPPSFLPWDVLIAGTEKIDAREIVDLQSRVRVRDVAMLLYTSGTTAHPRGARLSHEALVRTGRVFGLERFRWLRGIATSTRYRSSPQHDSALQRLLGRRRHLRGNGALRTRRGAGVAGGRALHGGLPSLRPHLGGDADSSPI